MWSLRFILLIGFVGVAFSNVIHNEGQKDSTLNVNNEVNIPQNNVKSSDVMTKNESNVNTAQSSKSSESVDINSSNASNDDHIRAEALSSRNIENSVNDLQNGIGNALGDAQEKILNMDKTTFIIIVVVVCLVVLLLAVCCICKCLC